MELFAWKINKAKLNDGNLNFFLLFIIKEKKKTKQSLFNILFFHID